MNFLPLKTLCRASVLVVCCTPLVSHGIDLTYPVVEHRGICDASGAVDLGRGRFAVADDELNILLVYEAHGTGEPIYKTEISRFLGVVKQSKKKDSKKQNEEVQQKPPRVREVDIEGATRVGDTVYWIASHGRKASGKEATERMRFFATSIDNESDQIELRPKGEPYDGLRHDLLSDPRYAPLRLAAAAAKPDKSPGGLSIEAITDTVDGKLLIGFRSPLIEGRALVATLINPEEVLQGNIAMFEEPILLELAGNGIRGLSSHRGDFLIAANDPEGDDHDPQLFRWDGKSPYAQPLETLRFGDFNPEALAILPDYRDGELLLLSDDGNRLIGPNECKCKDLKDTNLRRFRSATIKYAELMDLPPTR